MNSDARRAHCPLPPRSARPGGSLTLTYTLTPSVSLLLLHAPAAARSSPPCELDGVEELPVRLFALTPVSLCWSHLLTTLKLLVDVGSRVCDTAFLAKVVY